jgi:hypothetical protein
MDIRIVALVCVLAMTYAIGTGEYLIEISVASFLAMGVAAFSNLVSHSRRKPPPAEPWYMK